MAIFMSYVLLGLSLAAPIGPVNAAQLDRGIKNGFFHAWLVGLGAITADVIYMLLVFFGLVHFLQLPFMQTFLWLFGFFVLVYTGIETISSVNHLKEATNMRTSETYRKSFIYGFLMSISNPLTILFWLGIFGSVLAKTASVYGPAQLVFYSSAILIGLLLWDVAMAGIASGARHMLTPARLKIVSILSGLTLIGFGVYFGLQACRVLFG
ncbi:LysE family transporter [Halalkalibacterium halodurans]|uniref:BH2170 protein n=2 Tax=Halalkalibacterium halodurans TaxID=86665 RepID=Q9KAW6_HALH5|nr:LysE family transporter [Halalkalibacterium halodurans]MED4082982.1 LysE family transporter [Halalkalibacterium halodurans]MED4087143.1 LysE family transporter [Halalkalibacterium halodurans]MED4107014.1 LysE family transporter [Halalkalibacterium halodurans]MED4110927.1 LysE family transporter [Halalkalibacterium halodurans]MED4123642.1 LysE family transporter [Halalkalibacterium halodurans]